MTGSAKDRSTAQAEREARRAAALRENLKRRKQQARGRADEDGEKPVRETDDRGQG
jgi:hypothetical protein